MRTSEFQELSDPAWDGFVIVSAEVGAPAPNTRRIRRIPKDVFFQDITGPQGPAGSPGAPGAPGTNGTNGTNGTDGAFTGRVITGTADQIDVADGDGVSGNPTISLATNARNRQFGITVDGGGSVITTGLKGYIRVPYSMTITGWEVVASDGLAGAIRFDVWKNTYGNIPLSVADTITAFDKPLISATGYQGSGVAAGWDTAVAAGDYIGFNVDSVATLTRVHLSIFGVLI